jgi:hypothetical protein
MRYDAGGRGGLAVNLPNAEARNSACRLACSSDAALTINLPPSLWITSMNDV